MAPIVPAAGLAGRALPSYSALVVTTVARVATDRILTRAYLLFTLGRWGAAERLRSSLLQSPARAVPSEAAKIAVLRPTMTSENVLPGRPRHPRITDLRAAWDDLDSPLREAARSLLNELTKLESELARLDYSGARAALEKAEADDEGLDDWPFVPPPEPAEGTDPLRDVETYEACANRLLPVTAGLLALDLLRRERDPVTAGEQLRDEPWFLRHEVLVRLAWMRHDQELLAAGRTRRHPYRCTVANRAESRFRRTDREFHTLLLFGHGLKMAKGREILLVEKRERPDFAVLDVGDGTRLGVEITEAPQSDRWSKEEAFREQARRVIGAVLEELGLLADIERVADWARLGRRRTELGRALRRELTRVGTPERPTDIFLEEFGLKLSLVTSRAGETGLRFEGAGFTGEDAVERANAELRKSVISAIEKKVSGAPPKIRPTLLVCYVAHDYPARVESVLESIGAGDLPNCASRFEEVWCVWEEDIAQLL